MYSKGYAGISILVASMFMVSCKRTGTMFTSLSSSETNIRFSNILEKRPAFNILYFLDYYNGGGVSIGDIDNDGLPDIYFTANSKAGNKLYLNKGNFRFEDITESAGVAGSSDWCTGTTMADVNGDGLLDIYVSAVNIEGKLQGHNELFINNGNRTFAESSEKSGLNFSGFTGQSAFFDYDRDGDLDCYILNQSYQPNQNIVDTSKRRIMDPKAGDRLYRNDGVVAPGGIPHFTDVSSRAGIYQSNLGYGLGISIADLNNDGWDDIYIGNDFHENDYYYINNGSSAIDTIGGKTIFTESGARHFGHYSRFSMGNDIGDVNNDGQLDIITVDMLPPTEQLVKTYGSDENFDTYNFKISQNGFQNQASRNCLQINNGNGISFSETGLQSGVSATDWSWCPLFADFDNDGKKDLFISSGIVKRPVDLDYVRFVSDLASKIDKNDPGKYDDKAIEKMPEGSSHSFLFKGDGNAAFKDVSDAWGTGRMNGFYNGAAYGDLDNDGNLDLVINCLNNEAIVLKNQRSANNHLSLSFRGDGMNKFGVGTKAYLFTHDSLNRSHLQYQELMPARGFQSSSDTRLHFGLGADSTIDSILVVWPDQKYQVVKKIIANKQMVFLQKDAAGRFDPARFFPVKNNGFDDVTSQIKCDWKHKENPFIDFNIQYLIPHEESTRGPKIAVADVNGDGLDDLYLCGAKFQPGALMLQQRNGSFMRIDTALFAKDAICEDMDASFFDANGDGYADLYVVSGGNEPMVSSAAKQDRLYLNDGKGRFTKSTDLIQLPGESKSCVTVADIDHDGDIDVFVGTLSETFTYGDRATSYLLLNDGKGGFSLSGQSSLFSHIGMVTSAAFTDINKDGWPDLVVSGEFMPMKIYINNNGKFTGNDVANSSGIWQTIYPADVNGDGYPDILAGNWGHNTKLWAGKNGPVKLYVKDFDHNGSVEQILCYTIDSNEYTFLAKDELEKALPVLKKVYLTYSDVAGKSVQYMFYDLFKDYTEFKAETLSSSCFMNDGHGNFTRMDLPPALQLAPVFSFISYTSNDNVRQWLAAGNFYGVLPYEGRYDALAPTSFSYGKSSNTFNVEQKLASVSGEARDQKWVNILNGQKMLALARNNESLLFYKLSEK